MSDTALDGEDLVRLLERVFDPQPADRRLLVITDLPDDVRPDRPAWADRRRLAADWARKLAGCADDTGIDAELLLYRNVRTNNAELPARACRHDPARPVPAHADALDDAASVSLPAALEGAQIVLAPTELSTTAPLKLAARQTGLRAATMPGFSPAMLPALRLDYREIDRRVRALKRILDQATGAHFRFRIDDRRETRLFLDLRWRTAHASSGLLTEPGTAGNLPSGEAYIVPYEGERSDAVSRTAGVMPVELEGEVVEYRIEENCAQEAFGNGPMAIAESRRLAEEPAYGNIAELGLGVLGAFDIKPIGVVLLDEKLGPHIAFGRSDHFGGQIGPGDFRTPEDVVHIDRVYLPETQPRVRIRSIVLEMPDDGETELWRGDDYADELFA